MGLLPLLQPPLPGVTDFLYNVWRYLPLVHCSKPFFFAGALLCQLPWRLLARRNRNRESFSSKHEWGYYYSLRGRWVNEEEVWLYFLFNSVLAHFFWYQKHIVQSLGDMDDVRRIGSGISGEVYRMKHRPSGIMLAAKVLFLLIVACTVHFVLLASLAISSLTRFASLQSLWVHLVVFFRVALLLNAVPLQKMIWQQESWEEQRRVLMDLEVMTSHHCPQIVEYYGSAIINVSFGERERVVQRRKGWARPLVCSLKQAVL